MLFVRIIVVNIIMIDIHANMRVSKQSDGNVIPDRMWLYNLASRKGWTIGLQDVAALVAATKL
jgi:hypothetical protein